MNKKSLGFFKSIFDSSPNLAILHINNDCNTIKKITKQIAQDSCGTFKNIELSTIDEKNFRIGARDFEYVIISNCLEYIQNKKQFLTRIYHSLENSAQILILDKKDNMNIDNIKQLLDDTHYLAANEVDIFEDYDLIVAKKMHMWGAGL
ncbi:MAG: hypothetical protein KAQ94_04455 [Arcobacteraceae bacterium]|nr:hypothetical protein [Arcobacteraceae bacterium]